VSDFVLVVMPASLLVLPLLDLFGLYQSAIVREQVSFDIARHAALADVSLDEALEYKQQRDSSSQLTRNSSVDFCVFLASSELERRITFWPEVVQLTIQGRAECEN